MGKRKKGKTEKSYMHKVAESKEPQKFVCVKDNETPIIVELASASTSGGLFVKATVRCRTVKGECAGCSGKLKGQITKATYYKLRAERKARQELEIMKGSLQ